MPHDRKHDLNAEETAGVSAEDHSGERKPGLSARSLAGRGDAPDGSDDGAAKDREPADGSGET
jgi:hypothetical protein